jgi:cyclohexyl-isocyanide hydratase
MFHIGILVFPLVQQLDLTGPFEVFSAWPDALVWKSTEPLVSSTGLWLRPTIAFEDAPRFDIICVPGGRGVDPLLLDDAARGASTPSPQLRSGSYRFALSVKNSGFSRPS